MVTLKKVASPPAKLRNAYLDSLLEPQELYLELQVAAGNAWHLDDVAYAVACGSKLVEFYVAPQEAHRVVEIFDAAMKTTNASTVLCKSYDTQMLYAALAKPATVRPSGLLFRRIANTSFKPRKDVSFRYGTDTDATTIYSFNDGFFESLEEIKAYASIDGLFVLEREGEAVGCGIGKPVVDNRPDIDIGMLVAKQHRRNGYGGHIIALLKDHYVKKNMRPICGCSIDNVGSQQALKNAGFVSEHRLLEISY